MTDTNAQNSSQEQSEAPQDEKQPPRERLFNWFSIDQDGNATRIPDEEMRGMRLP